MSASTTTKSIGARAFWIPARIGYATLAAATAGEMPPVAALAAAYGPVMVEAMRATGDQLWWAKRLGLSYDAAAERGRSGTTWTKRAIADAVKAASVDGEMPSAKTLRDTYGTGMVSAVYRHGKFGWWAQELNLTLVNRKSLAQGAVVARCGPRDVKWTDQTLADAVSALAVNGEMPGITDLKDAYGGGMVTAMYRRGKLAWWAQELNLTLVNRRPTAMRGNRNAAGRRQPVAA